MFLEMSLDLAQKQDKEICSGSGKIKKINTGTWFDNFSQNKATVNGTGIYFQLHSILDCNSTSTEKKKRRYLLMSKNLDCLLFTTLLFNPMAIAGVGAARQGGSANNGSTGTPVIFKHRLLID